MLSGVEQEPKRRPTGHKAKRPSYESNCSVQCILPSSLDLYSFIATCRLV